MKKATTLIVLAFISLNVFAKCDGHLWLSVYNDSILVNSYTNLDTQPVNALLAPGDWVEMKIAGDLILCSSTVLLVNGTDTIMSGLMPSTPYYLTLTDAGHYFLHYHSTSADWTWEFDVSYSSTGLQNISEQPFQIYPSGSEGTFRIQSAKTLKHLLVFNNAGRTIIETSNVFSDINLTRFSNGIYFYAITDENERVWRGKLLRD
jgi:hypothetical protein